ncbi:Sarcosine oxidase subunit alpha [Bosea sp. 62]|uniref:sarcosine oxidase subunit alpha family protein n=1 Tax=unclassified Bosea (in: a-proteobacteria) TaxID=2653178 RepID=UPI00125B7E40|nr:MULTISPECIES: sarcosine oxidase subunit alpha family protein [unclassified Bosea (in: a-proteobacteria)]CAD5293459.1 Sarcosine oxidase subunit alpha [Bosea sp. 21B]CAD5294009.1 Sarcosine oxidase subunit alpha [Bosea sp. 46]CAD5299282.1 Sarcosine oxidase subunit alpha [Bosea sp. 7B]VVT62156.1 Sarcosine oxidase subunit alpha [Bosea sp. EC-HK365B]VXB11063.1 Sarcosine oxidase subunit alpha [Bosea sp. 125]
MSTQPFRLASGGLIDRGHQLDFSFDGTSYRGYAGDTLASALLANGVRLVGRSFKYHRPRGILSAGPEEPNALVELRSGARREPNTRATVVELFAGLDAASQNRWPLLAFDLLSINGLVSPALVAGFYYKTFMWPASFWEKLYEPLIRRAAGLGRAAGSEDPDHYEKAFAFCDLLVIGGGPAGLAAALAAGRSGARVILCDEDFRLGGRLLAEKREIGGKQASEWLAATLAELQSLPEVRIMSRTTVFGLYDHGIYGAVERVADHLPRPPAHLPRQRGWRIQAKRAILAAGALERPIVFAGNDRPGVMLAGAVRSYVNRHGVLPGRETVLFTAGDDGWTTARDIAAAGGKVAAIVDSRPADPARKALADKLGARLFAGGAVMAARGGRQLSGVTIRDASGAKSELSCDLLAVSNGWNPTLHLTSHQNGKPAWDDGLQCFVPGTVPAGLAVAGSAAGRFTLAQALEDGARLGSEAAVEAGLAAIPAEPIPATDPETNGLAPVWRVSGGKGKAFVDYQNDVTDKDVELAAREGFRPVEHLKRYTTLGMATDQGKTSNLSGLAIMAEQTGRTIPQTGTTTFRPPYTPVAIGALAGHHRGKDFRPIRLAPTHDWSKEQGAVFVEAGPWLRAQYYPRPGENDWLTTVNREVKAVRAGVGLCDVSTLGKIDIQGADAAEFLERVYINGWKALPVGKARYGLMLREDGFVMDDGTTSRLGETHFLMTTTTANAGKVMQHLEFCHQVLWPELDVRMVSVSEQWAQVAIAGPKARETLRGVIDPEHDLSNEAFPYLAARAVTVGSGIPARLFRISFSGELAYELAVPADYGDAMVRALMQAGAPFGITPYGTEALGVMRIEKGHVAGNELNGQTTARDLGLGKMMSSKKDFVGRLMAGRQALVEQDRPAFVGFKPVEPGQRLRAGAHFIGVGKPAVMENDEGYMTSVAYSPHLNRWMGLGLIRGGAARIGERVRAYDPVRNGDVVVEICSPIFVDPEGARLHG